MPQSPTPLTRTRPTKSDAGDGAQAWARFKAPKENLLLQPGSEGLNSRVSTAPFLFAPFSLAQAQLSGATWWPYRGMTTSCFSKNPHHHHQGAPCVGFRDLHPPTAEVSTILAFGMGVGELVTRR